MCFPGEHTPDRALHDKLTLSVDQFRAWVAKYEETDYVRAQRIAITKMHNELFSLDQDGPKLTPIDYSNELP